MIHLVLCILLIMSVNRQKSILAVPWLVEMLLLLAAGIGFSIFLFVIGYFDPVDFVVVGAIVLLAIFGKYGILFRNMSLNKSFILNYIVFYRIRITWVFLVCRLPFPF